MFKVILNLCREAKLANEALGVFRKMREFGCRPDTTSFNIVIRMFCEKGDMDVVLVLTKEMALIGVFPDMITYVVSIKRFCEVGHLEDACGLVKVMRDQGCVPNVVAYFALLDGFCKIGDFDKAMELLGEMEKEENGGMPNVVTYTSLIQNFCDNDRPVEALAVLDRMGSRGCFPNQVTISTLIRRLCSDDNIEEAHIVSLLRNKNMSEANGLFRWMLKNQIKPAGLASSILIKQLCLDGQILEGFEYYDEMEKIDCLPSI
ncbi:hypothetical protein IFM89_033694 [Coptis chinensis]|uniref:Pentatricopeptide repeat-containing protein n=1 Tax=Coptis chinensis TaxID=261450 RepID=A0A835HIT2_9MAGN|nr:hypothetical protein IFM89_033694 [Coptis chinensis]